jgi:hypothetical protein
VNDSRKDDQKDSGQLATLLGSGKNDDDEESEYLLSTYKSQLDNLESSERNRQTEEEINELIKQNAFTQDQWLCDLKNLNKDISETRLKINKNDDQRVSDSPIVKAIFENQKLHQGQGTFNEPGMLQSFGNQQLKQSLKQVQHNGAGHVNKDYVMSNESDGNVIISQPRLTNSMADKEASLNSPEMKVKRVGSNGNSFSNKKPT